METTETVVRAEPGRWGLVLVRTITETFEVSDAAESLYAEAEGSVPPDEFHIDMHERHGGSLYGDELYGNVDYDHGYELFWRDSEGSDDVPYSATAALPLPESGLSAEQPEGEQA